MKSQAFSGTILANSLVILSNPQCPLNQERIDVRTFQQSESET